MGNAKAKVREEHLQALYGHSFFAMRRARMKLVYNSLALQYMTAVVVILAFLNDLIEAQIAPPSKLAKLAAGCFDQEGFIARIVSDPYRVRVQARRLFARPSLNPPVWRPHASGQTATPLRKSEIIPTKPTTKKFGSRDLLRIKVLSLMSTCFTSTKVQILTPEELQITIG